MTQQALDVSSVLSEQGWNSTPNGMLLLAGALMAGMPRQKVLTECRQMVAKVIAYDDIDHAFGLSLDLTWLYQEDLMSLEQLRTMATIFGEMTRVAQARSASTDNKTRSRYEQAMEMRLHYQLLQTFALIDSCALDEDVVSGIRALFEALVAYRACAGATAEYVQQSAADAIRKRVRWSNVYNYLAARQAQPMDPTMKLRESGSSESIDKKYYLIQFVGRRRHVEGVLSAMTIGVSARSVEEVRQRVLADWELYAPLDPPVPLRVVRHPSGAIECFPLQAGEEPNFVHGLMSERPETPRG